MAVWMYLLTNATHKSLDGLFGGKRITLRPGQLITGRKSISAATGVDESKVRRILNWMKSDQQIDQQTSNKSSMITVVNWACFQKIDQQKRQQPTTNRPATDQQPTTNKNGKNVKHGDNDENFGSLPRSFVEGGTGGNRLRPRIPTTAL